MLHSNSKETRLTLCLVMLSALLVALPIRAGAEAMVLAEAETGSKAAQQAADQRAALAKKAAEREARKAAESQKPAEVKAPDEPAGSDDAQKEK